jgi:hypothetical protein
MYLARLATGAPGSLLEQCAYASDLQEYVVVTRTVRFPHVDEIDTMRWACHYVVPRTRLSWREMEYTTRIVTRAAGKRFESPPAERVPGGDGETPHGLKRQIRQPENEPGQTCVGPFLGSGVDQGLGTERRVHHARYAV